jgi:hypothetical protein
LSLPFSNLKFIQNAFTQGARSRQAKRVFGQQPGETLKKFYARFKKAKMSESRFSRGGNIHPSPAEEPLLMFCHCAGFIHRRIHLRTIPNTTIMK